MNLAIYSRKSKFTGKGESIENQIDMCTNYVKAHFDENCDIFIYEDEGFTGANTDRPQFKRCINDIKNGKIDVLVCYRLDRISRNVADFSFTLELLEKNNCSFVSIKEQFDTSTPMGRAMMYIASVFAQLERETIAERIRDNMIQLAKTGRWLGGITPTGFESKELSYQDLNGKMRKSFMLVPIDDEVQTVKLIFEKYLEFKSLTKVETYLLQHHITTKNNINFTRFSIRTLLNNPVYAIADKAVFNYFEINNYEIYSPKNEFNGTNGVMAYNKTIQKKNQANKLRDTSEWIIAIGKHEGIIEGYKWARVQELLEQNRSKTFRKTRNQEALLSGILRCAKCGSYMRPKMGRTLKDGSNMFYYLCELKEASKRARCDCSNAPGPKLDNLVLSYLINQSSNTSNTRKKTTKIKYSLSEQAGLINDEVKSLTEIIKDNETSINNLVATLASSKGTAAEKYIIKQINELDAENCELKEKIFDLKQRSTVLEFEENKTETIDKMLSDFGQMLSTTVSSDKQKGILKRIVDKVEWDGENIDITLIGSSHTAIKEMFPLCENSKYNPIIMETFEHSEKLELIVETDAFTTTGERLKFYRLKAKLTQDELAKASNMSVCTIKRFESNKRAPNASTCQRLANALNIDINLLYDEHLKFISNDYSTHIKAYRKSANLTQQQLADILNISKKTLSCWERKAQYPSKQMYKRINELIN